MRAAWDALIVLLIAVAAAAQTKPSTPPPNAPVAYVYVGQNTSPNQVSAFQAGRNGTLQNISGSPFAGIALSVVVSSGFVWATDGQSIATYTRSPNGALTQTSVINGTAHNDTPVGSFVGSLTLDRSGSTLYAQEFDSDGTDDHSYAAFMIQPNGALTFLANSGISSFYQSPLQFSQNNQFAYGNGCYFLTWDVYGFQRAADGSLIDFSPGNQMPPTTEDNFLCPIFQAVSARGFLAQAYEFFGSQAGLEQIAIYQIVPGSGTLELIANSEITPATNGVNGLRFDPTGRFLAVTGANGIQSFRIDDDGMLTAVGAVQDSTVSLANVAWDKCKHVYTISSYNQSDPNGSALYVYTMSRAGLTRQNAPTPVPAAASLAAEPEMQCRW